MRERSRSNRQALRALETTDPDYAAKLSNLAVEQGQLATERTQLMGRVRAEVGAELTPEQREQLATEMDRMRDRAERRFRRRGADEAL